MVSSVFIVSTLQPLLTVVFMSIDFVLSLPYKIFGQKSKSSSSQLLSETKRTVVIVGANFAGLKALKELKANAGSNKNAFRIIIIDQKNYFEYVPGVLRLFCDPEHFSNISGLIEPHLDKHDSSSHQVIQGKVVSMASENILCYTTPGSTSIKNLPFDYLILATGASASQPITAATASSAADSNEINLELTLIAREQAWKTAHEKLVKAKSVLVLGAGATGVELAAEIKDFFPAKRVTIVDANTTILPRFPKATREHAAKWLTKNHVDLQLGQKKLKTWNDTTCTLEDGTILQADIVYDCFGEKPNSSFLDASSSTATTVILDRNKCIVVRDTLQLENHHHIFACGNVAAPRHGAEKQAFQAEMQAVVASRNVIRHVRSDKLLRYPQDLSGLPHAMPLIYVLSLGRYDGAMGFNRLHLTGPLAAILKWILEYTKVLDMGGKSPLGKLVWKIADQMVLFLSRTILKPLPSTQTVAAVSS